jgi:hypothetical protein
MNESGLSKDEFLNATLIIDEQKKKIADIADKIIYEAEKNKLDFFNGSNEDKQKLKDIIKDSIIDNVDIFNISHVEGKDKIDLIKSISEEVLGDKPSKFKLTDDLVRAIDMLVKKNLANLQDQTLQVGIEA